MSFEQVNFNLDSGKYVSNTRGFYTDTLNAIVSSGLSQRTARLLLAKVAAKTKNHKQAIRIIAFLTALTVQILNTEKEERRKARPKSA